MKVYMFHYVKPFSNYYHYDLDLFEKTIQYLKNNNHIISLKEFDEWTKENKQIPEDCVMLTFDDGTLDHYQYVYPILKKYNCSGLFFIPSCTYNKKKLDIQIIHQLLENNSIDTLYDDLEKELRKKKIRIEEYAVEKNLDNKKNALFKQLLQYKLPKEIRKNLLHYFEKKYNVSGKSKDTYMSIRNLKEMKKSGMYFGIHTISHPRLSLLKKEEQAEEIKGNMDCLLKSGLIEKELLSLAFPYGSYNRETLNITNDLNIKYGFKVDSRETDEESGGVMLIDRLDCNVLKEVLK